MTLVKQKPTTPGRRGMVKVQDASLHRERPHRPLVEIARKTNGRNNLGRVTVRHRGGAHKRLYRIIDFKRDKDGIPAKVERIEYDPNRSANIALLLYADGERRYIVAARGLKTGSQVMSGPDAPIAPGNALPLVRVPLGTTVHCIEMKPGKGAQIARSAGASAQYLGREGKYALMRMRSGEVRKINVNCRVTIGEVGNEEHGLRKLGKAGAKRWRGIRPTVRGVAMNPVDHPHGGGEGKTSGGRDPVSPWGVPTKGYRTRRNRRTDDMIIRRSKKRR